MQRPVTVAAAVFAALAGSAAAVLPWAAPAVHADSNFDSALFSLLNQDRASQGLPALQWSSTLSSIAENSTYSGCGYSVAGRAEDMVQRNYFSHTILNCGGNTVFAILRADNVPFNSAAENLGWISGTTDPQAAASAMNNQFMASSEHSGIILNPNFNTVGVGSWWTAPGATWSGGGTNTTNTVVAAVEFTQTPAGSAAPPPPPPPPAPPAPHRTAPVQRASRPVTHAVPQALAFNVAAPAAVAAAVAVPAASAGEDARPTHAVALPGVETGVWHVAASAGTIPRAPAVSLAMTCGGVILGVWASLRGAVQQRRRRRRT